MKQIVVFPRGQLTDKDRRALSRAGVCVVEADDPSKVVMVLPSAEVGGNEMLAIALESMLGCRIENPHRPFVARLQALVQKRISEERR